MTSFINTKYFALAVVIFLIGISIGGFLFLNQGLLGVRKQGEVTTKTSSSPIPSLTPSPSLIASPSAEPAKNPYAGQTYSIAVYGDSMVETMGEYMDYLSAALKAKYPGTNFVLYNYGIGAENAQMGLDRFERDFNRVDRHYLPITRIDADIIIMGSFAYNPFTPHDKSKHLSVLTDLVNRSKAVSKKVYILAEIAPLQDGFGAGPGGVNWPEVTADEHTPKIKEQLDNAVFLSKTLGVGLINSYAASKNAAGYGKPQYVNPHDGIHPSVTGHQFMANMIANTIRLD